MPSLNLSISTDTPSNSLLGDPHLRLGGQGPVGPIGRDSKIGSTGDPREDLRRTGFSYLRGTDFAVPAELTGALKSFTEAFNELPEDGNAVPGTRFRCHQRFVLIPEPLTLVATAISNYAQSVFLNTKDGGSVREFEPLPRDLAGNSFLRALILYDFNQSPFSEMKDCNLVYDVGVHMIRMLAFPGQPAVASPNHLHKDGEWATWVHLVSRKRISGGGSVITDNNRKVLMEGTLNQFLDTVAVWDDSVYHHVNPVRVAQGEEEGYRDVLLVDVTPMLALTKFEDAINNIMTSFRARLGDMA